MRWTLLLTVILVSMLFAQAEVQDLTPVEILQKADTVVNEPKDQDLKIRLVLIDKESRQKERVMTMLQKGGEKRLVKFLSPADQKGIAFLDLPEDVMYLYLPAFKKVRRIASHVKNTSFAGTDFTYDDMGTINYSDDYTPELSKETEHCFVLKLTPKEGVNKDYQKLLMWVRKSNFYPAKIEYYDRANKLYKVMEREKIEKVGNYWIAKEAEMADLKKEHKTKMFITEVQFDTGLKDELFTRRYLKR